MSIFEELIHKTRFSWIATGKEKMSISKEIIRVIKQRFITEGIPV